MATKKTKLHRRLFISGSFSAACMAAIPRVSAWASQPPLRPQRQDQSQEINLQLQGLRDEPVTLALPAFSLLPGAEAEATALHGVLWNDLYHSMVFDLVDPDFYPAGESGDGPPDFAAWRQTGADALIRSFVRRDGDELVVQYRLYDVASGGEITSLPSYPKVPPTGPQASHYELRQSAHEFSDEVVLHYTGVRGVALTKIAFVSQRQRRGPKEIYVMDYDGFTEQRITNDGGLALAPALSPRGDRIAYVSYRSHNGVPNADIAMLSITGGIPPVIVRSDGQDFGPTWSPDAKLLAFYSDMGRLDSANAEIYTVAANGEELRQLTDNAAIDGSPTFSPDGGEIAFISGRGGGQHLYKMNVDGTDLKRLDVDGTQIDSPSWNPNSHFSDLITYAASEGGASFRIFVHSVTSGKSWKLPSGYGRADSPCWSPDGRHIVFEAAQSGQTHIYAMGFDGSRLRKLTRDGNNQSPSWGGRLLRATQGPPRQGS